MKMRAFFFPFVFAAALFANAAVGQIVINGGSNTSVANPTATIGLSAVNGTAFTALRSDGAPALSQAIVPMWSGLHTFNNGAEFSGFPISGTFTGSGGAGLFGINQTATAGSATTPEIGIQTTINSNVGIANKTTAYKIGQFIGVLGTSNSANIYGLNIVTRSSGPNNFATGVEVDQQTMDGNAGDYGTGTAAYGFAAVASGNFTGTAGYWATGANDIKWRYGFASTNFGGGSNITVADFLSASSSPTVLLGTGTHTTGIDFTGATLTTGIALANNVPLAQRDSGATLRNTLKLNGSNVLELGTTSNDVSILSTSVSTNTSNGALRVSGGVGINGDVRAKSVNVEQNDGSAFRILPTSVLLSGLSGASVSTTNFIPAGATALECTTRVTTAITGATSYSVGDGTDVDRYGASIAIALGTTSASANYTADPRWWAAAVKNITLTANGSNFTGGAVRVTCYYQTSVPPAL